MTKTCSAFAHHVEVQEKDEVRSDTDSLLDEPYLVGEIAKVDSVLAWQEKIEGLSAPRRPAQSELESPDQRTARAPTYAADKPANALSPEYAAHAGPDRRNRAAII